MMKKHNWGMKAAILTMSFVQMGTNGVAAILADIAEAFPKASVMSIQFLMTCPSLFVMAVSLASAWISNYISRKKMVMTGLSLVCTAGFLSSIFYQSLLVLYLWAALLGIGIGLTVPIAFALISEYFSGEERMELTGWQSSASNLGSMLMTFVGGFLAVISWQLDYLVYFIALPGLVLTALFVPDEKGGKSSMEIKKIPIQTWIYGISIAVFMLVFYIGPSNLAMLAAERQFGGASVSGIAATMLLLGGAVMGIFFGKFSRRLGIFMIPLGFVVQAAGFILLYLAGGTGQFLAACFLAGAGVSITLPQCMMQLAQSRDPKVNAFSSAFGLACGNLGTFAAPFLTKAAVFITGQQTAESRFLFSAILALLLAAVCCLLSFTKTDAKGE